MIARIPHTQKHSVGFTSTLHLEIAHLISQIPREGASTALNKIRNVYIFLIIYHFYTTYIFSKCQTL